MIKVTIWNEYVQETTTSDSFATIPMELTEEKKQEILETTRKINALHPGGIHETLRALFEEDPEIEVRHVALLRMPDCGLTEEVLADTDVLVWWAHIAHQDVPDEIAARVRDHVLRGMGFLALHSAHPSKPMQQLLGTSGSLQWREGDFCRVWNICPTHPIAAGVPQSFELEPEEMYGEFFDIPKPDDVVFLSWFRGGEVFRSGCTWTRGRGKMFYFQPGHESNPSFFDPNVRRILKNAAHWLAPAAPRAPALSCPHAEQSPEAAWRAAHEK